MRRFDGRELSAAAAVMAFGAFWLAIGLGYPMGTIVRMGAGFFPVALSVILIGLGAVLAWQSRREDSEPLDFRWRPFLFILGGVLAWALLVDEVGFLPATMVLVALCAMAERSSTWRSAAVLAVGLCAFGYLVFIRGLKIPLSVIGA